MYCSVHWLVAKKVVYASIPPEDLARSSPAVVPSVGHREPRLALAARGAVGLPLALGQGDEHRRAAAVLLVHRRARGPLEDALEQGKLAQVPLRPHFSLRDGQHELALALERVEQRLAGLACLFV